MPAVSKAQQHLMGMAFAIKRGGLSRGGMAARLAKSMTEKQLRDFAKGSMRGKPEHKR